MEKKRSKLWKIISMVIIIAMVFTTAMSEMTYAASNVITPRITSATSTRTTATIKWSVSKNATGYMVYRAFNNSHKYIKVKTLRGRYLTSFKNSNLKMDSRYKFKVRAYRKVDNKTYYSRYSSYRSVVTKPPEPALGVPRITSLLPAATKVTLDWSEVGGANGYEIYRSQGVDNLYEYVGTVSGGYITRYVDEDVQRNTTYSYKINAYRGPDSNRKYSKFSEYDIVTTLNADTITVDKPEILGGRVTETTATINWRHSGDVDGYLVYRCDTANGNYVEIDRIETNSAIGYEDTGLQKDTTYYYRLKAYKVVNGKEIYSDLSDYKKLTTEGAVY